MRIACVYIPSFPLQAALIGRRDVTGVSDASAHAVVSSAMGAIAVVAQPPVGSPVVVACSRAAWTAGVRPGMSATVARTAAPDLQTIVADVVAERALLRALGEALLGVAPRVDLGGEPRGQHHVMYLEVPAGRRGSWFGARVRDLLAVFGLGGRVGIADDRFTAFVAASAGARDDGDAVVCVPRGGSAAYLAPQPLALLRLGPEIQHMLEALGVRTLGAFASLPPPSVMRPDRGNGWDADFQALARGDGGCLLEDHVPTGPVVERVTIDPAAPGAAASSLGAAVQALARRLAARLAGRAAVPAELVVRMTGAEQAAAIRPAVLAEGAVSADDLADAIGRALGGEAWTTIEVIARADAAPAAAVAPAAAAGASRAVASEAPRHEVAPLVLLPSPAAYGRGGERVEHRRTRRGKQRPRIGAGQARLFAGE